MELYMKNVGIIRETTIALDGITVIAGENNTGKSTVSRAIFSLLNGYSNVDDRIKGELENSLRRALSPLFRTRPSLLRGKIIQEITEHMDKYRGNPELIREYLIELDGHDKRSPSLQEISIDRVAEMVSECLNVSKEEIFYASLEKNLNAEFNGQIQNIYTKETSKIKLRLEDKTISVDFQDGHVIKNSDLFEAGLSAVYLDSPMILDEGRFPWLSLHHGIDHQEHLRNCLFSEKKMSTLIEEIVMSKKLSRVYEMISKVCSGDFMQKDGEFIYREKADREALNISNLSDGLKTFVILKTLLLNGFIEPGSVILLDEPEIHLHPEWQLLLAEIIVLLHKEFNLYVLLNTHSHYFLDAIEVYSKKHGVSNACQYYLSSMDGEFSIIENVTKNTEKIYKKLARPLQQLENERYQNED